MALGLVAAGIIFSYVYQEFHYDAGYKNSSNIYQVIDQAGQYGPVAQTLKSNLPEIKDAVRVSYFYGYLACVNGDNKYNETAAIFTDPNFFDFFSFPLVKGNSSTCLQGPNSIVLSETVVQKYFNSADPIGQQLRIGNDNEFTVTGVFQDFKVNSNFSGGLVIPLETISELTPIGIETSWEHGCDINTFVLLNDQANPDELSEKTKKLVSQYLPPAESKCRFMPLKDIHIKNLVNVTKMYILVGTAIFILLISASNFLFLFVGMKSRQNISTGIKKVCGASKLTLFLEFFSETLILMVLSVFLAVMLYGIYNEVAREFLTFLPRIVYFDYKLLLLLFAVATGVGLLSGLYPALVLSSNVPVRIFSPLSYKTAGKMKLVNKLIIVQFSLCIAMIIGTLLIHRQVNFMENKNTGYARDELITIPLNMKLGDGIYNENFGAFSQELKKYPGIKNVTMAFSSPASVITSGDTPPDWQGKPEGKEVDMHWESVSYDYFETIGDKILAGRSFSPDFPADMINWDNRRGSFILNKSAVQAMEIDDPIGKEFKVWRFRGTIIGIADDYNFRSMHSAVSPMFYMANPVFLNEIIIRINPNSSQVLTDIKTVWDHFVPEYPLEFHFVNDQLKKLYYIEKSLADFLDVFSFLAIVIAAMGLFALTLISTNQRTKEIGIRKITGATVSGIVYLLLKDYLKLFVLANLIAWPITWYVMDKWLQNFAYRIEMSWWIFALAGVIVLIIAVLTVSWQTIRAALANPVESLRYE